jgi:hypothetical protein
MNLHVRKRNIQATRRARQWEHCVITLPHNKNCVREKQRAATFLCVSATRLCSFQPAAWHELESFHVTSGLISRFLGNVGRSTQTLLCKACNLLLLLTVQPHAIHSNFSASLYQLPSVFSLISPRLFWRTAPAPTQFQLLTVYCSQTTRKSLCGDGCSGAVQGECLLPGGGLLLVGTMTRQRVILLAILKTSGS